jgi:prepilin-type processing-associated H-X9-DG protein
MTNVVFADGHAKSVKIYYSTGALGVDSDANHRAQNIGFLSSDGTDAMYTNQ